MNSLQITDQEAQNVSVAPRVSLQEMEDKISSKHEFTGQGAINGECPANFVPELAILSICILVMKNGFTVIGKSAPASPENFYRELGKKFAYEDAVRQLWTLEGYTLREKLSLSK